VLKTQGTDYNVTAWDGSNTPGRQVVFTAPPATGALILISVSTAAAYTVGANQVQILGTVTVGDVFEIITWNDTAQQNMLTLVFKGPTDSGPGRFDLQRPDLVDSRLWVTLDGRRLFEGVEYSVDRGFIVLTNGAIGADQILAVTQFTNSVTPEEMAFRIFQDMRGVQAVYRITRNSTTQLAQEVTATADQIQVVDASILSEPNLELGIFGVIVIDGERIMYRVRNLATNTVSSLLRGTAGTATAAHADGAIVTDLGRGNLLDERYQDRVVSDTTVSDGSSLIYHAPSINIVNSDSSANTRAVEVYVGGVRQTQYAEIPPVTTVLQDNVQVPVFQYNIGEKYVIVELGNTDWNTIADSRTVRNGETYEIAYQAGDVFTAAVATDVVSTGLAYHIESQYRWVINEIEPLSIEFVVNSNTTQPLTAPQVDVEVTILVRQGLGWYGPGVSEFNGTALQDTQTPAARFLRGL
jgi:hypothetical protein